MKQPLSEYLKNKTIRTNLPWRYIGKTGQTGYLLANGVLQSEDHVKEMYPVMGKVTLWNHDHKGPNPDKTWIE